jgi:hypothetical protein
MPFGQTFCRYLKPRLHYKEEAEVPPGKKRETAALGEGFDPSQSPGRTRRDVIECDGVDYT